MRAAFFGISGTKGRGFNSRIARHFHILSLGSKELTKRFTAFYAFVCLMVVSISICNPMGTSKSFTTGQEKEEKPRLILIQREAKEEKGGEADPHYIQVLKSLQEKLNDWLKSLNERIEKEDIARLEVRFLEILRNILEWVKEKVDAQIESADKQKQKPMKKETGSFRETRQRVSRFSGVG